MSAPQAAPPATIFLFGARGDLVRRLLIPALFRLFCSGRLAPGFRIVGVDHNAGSDAEFRDRLGGFMQELAADPCAEAGGQRVNKRKWQSFARHLAYLQGDFLEADTYAAVGKAIQAADSANAVFYLATSPRFFGDVASHLAQAGLLDESRGAFRRLVVEKPFGTDLRSAQALNAQLLQLLDENRVYRIDHFRGKDAVRNILAARFGVAWMEAFWNRHYIEQVQITAAETLGVEQRGKFYEGTGALRDMVPNHLFQLLAMVAMEPPREAGGEALRDEVAKVLAAIRRYTPAQARRLSVRGQYAAGRSEGERVPAYRRETRVARDSNTETFVALKLFVDTWRWSGVPFYLRTGKRMGARATEIAIGLKPAPSGAFSSAPADAPAWLVIRIDPEEITLDFQAKRPGLSVQTVTTQLRFAAADHFPQPVATGYEALLYGCLTGDQTLFQRADAIEAAWRAVQPFQQAWAKDDSVLTYPAGSDGPKAARELLKQGGHDWHSA